MSSPDSKPPLSVLDLAPITEGGSAATALGNSRSLAQHVEQLGYQRYWLAEHHNMPGIASSATAVAIGYVAEGTSSIRVGAGGVMLPNHAPLIVAEQFGTLASLYPNRIDLGLGRAPGTDQHTAYALRRNLNSDEDGFPRDVVELIGYLANAVPEQPVRAIPGVGTRVPVWILGSSLYGAQLAAALGLPYAFASHFAPQMMLQALDIYRSTFRPSEFLDEPYAMLGFNVCAADSDEEAGFLFTSLLQAVINMRTGNPGRLPAPIENFAENLSPTEHVIISSFTECSAVGSQATVAARLAEFIEKTEADELMIPCQVFDHSARMRSYEILMSAWHSMKDKKTG